MSGIIAELQTASEEAQEKRSQRALQALCTLQRCWLDSCVQHNGKFYLAVAFPVVD